MTARLRAGVAGLVVLALLGSGCQLRDRQQDLQPADDGGADAATEAPLGSPDEEFPASLDALVGFARPEALAWQDQPVLADLTVWLDGEGTWERVRVTYVAPDADRMLTVRATPERLRVERPRLEGLQLLPVPADALAAIPPLPDDVLEPTDLARAAADALDQCGAEDRSVHAVLYATGAPAAWDGTAWSTVPAWRATVVTPSTGVSVDPTSGTAYAPLSCVAPLLLDQQ